MRLRSLHSIARLAVGSTCSLGNTKNLTSVVFRFQSRRLQSTQISEMCSVSENTTANRIAVVQMTATNNKSNNINVCNAIISAAAAKNAKIVFLPECFDFIGIGREETIALAETLQGPVIDNYKKIAKNHSIWISLGGFHRKHDNTNSKITNSHIIINHEGDIVAVYDKLHLFDVCLPEKKIELRESSTVVPGNEIHAPVSSPVGKIGLGVCYDLRFPEFSTKLRHKGVEILTFPSAFTVHTGAAHWEVLLRARAIENQCFVVAAAQIGTHNEKRSSYGHSMVVDPWGKILAEASDTDQLLLVDLDVRKLEQTRREMPVHDHKRTDVYGSLSSPLKKVCTIPSESEDEVLVDFGQVQVKKKYSFLESEHSRAFVNRKCILPGHVLLISKRKVERLSMLSDEEITDLYLLQQKVNALMTFVHETSATNVACQDGPAAGQSIAHVHIHVLPRKPGDMEPMDRVYEELEKIKLDSPKPHGNEDQPKWRPYEEMHAECLKLRSVIKEHFSSFLGES